MSAQPITTRKRSGAKGDNPANKKERRANLENRTSPLDAEGLLNILRPILIAGRHELPSGARLHVLVAKLELKRSMFEIKFNHFRESHKHNVAAYRAIEDLTTALNFFRPTMVELTHLLENSSKLDEGDEFAAENNLEAVNLPQKKFIEFRHALDAGDRIMQDLKSIKAPSPWFVAPATDPIFVKAWPAIIPDLIAMFHDAIPAIGTGVTNGSLNKCLAAVIPSITGERPSAAQIDSWRRGRG